MKKILFFILLSFLLVLPVQAQTITDNHFVNGENLNIEGNYEKDVFLSGTNINFSGNIDGDLFIIGQNIKVSGEVQGSIFFVASQIDLDAKVGGSVRGLAQKVLLKNSVAHNVTVFASVIDTQAVVDWHGYLVAKDMKIGGEFERLDIKTSKASIDAKIKNSLVIVGIGNATMVEINSPGEIGGNVDYTGKNKLSIANDVIIHGEINEKNIIPQAPRNIITYSQIFWWLVFLFGIILVGLVLITLFGNRLLILPRLIEKEKYKLLLPGLVVFILVPLVVFLLIISLIGIPLGMLLLLLYLLVFYIGQILLAIWLGDFIWQRLNQKPKLTQDSKNYLFWCLVLGAIIWRFIFAIPLFGGLIAWLVFLLLFGSIWRLAKVKIREN